MARVTKEHQAKADGLYDKHFKGQGIAPKRVVKLKEEMAKALAEGKKALPAAKKLVAGWAASDPELGPEGKSKQEDKSKPTKKLQQVRLDRQGLVLLEGEPETQPGYLPGSPAHDAAKKFFAGPQVQDYLKGQKVELSEAERITCTASMAAAKATGDKMLPVVRRYVEKILPRDRERRQAEANKQPTAGLVDQKQAVKANQIPELSIKKAKGFFESDKVQAWLKAHKVTFQAPELVVTAMAEAHAAGQKMFEVVKRFASDKEPVKVVTNDPQPKSDQGPAKTVRVTQVVPAKLDRPSLQALLDEMARAGVKGCEHTKETTDQQLRDLLTKAFNSIETPATLQVLDRIDPGKLVSVLKKDCLGLYIDLTAANCIACPTQLDCAKQYIVNLNGKFIQFEKAMQDRPAVTVDQLRAAKSAEKPAVAAGSTPPEPKKDLVTWSAKIQKITYQSDRKVHLLITKNPEKKGDDGYAFVEDLLVAKPTNMKDLKAVIKRHADDVSNDLVVEYTRALWKQKVLMV